MKFSEKTIAYLEAITNSAGAITEFSRVSDITAQAQHWKMENNLWEAFKYSLKVSMEIKDCSIC